MVGGLPFTLTAGKGEEMLDARPRKSRGPEWQAGSPAIHTPRGADSGLPTCALGTSWLEAGQDQGKEKREMRGGQNRSLAPFPSTASPPAAKQVTHGCGGGSSVPE